MPSQTDRQWSYKLILLYMREEDYTPLDQLFADILTRKAAQRDIKGAC